MKKIRGCGSLKFEDLGQGGKDMLCRGQSLTMISPGGGGGMVILVVVSIIVNDKIG